MNSFVIKLIAVVTMFMDHFGDVVVGHHSWLNYFGRIAFPLFCFQFVIGYKNTSNKKKFFIRLLLFALISQIPFMLMVHYMNGSYFALNIFFEFILGFIMLYVFDNVDNKFLKWALISLIIASSYFLHADYEIFGLLMILGLYVLSGNKAGSALVIILFSIFSNLHFFKFVGAPYYPLSSIIARIVVGMLAIIPILFYNNKKGPGMKYFFYLFYPIHILLLDLTFLLH